MGEIKIFSLNEYEWWAGRSLDEVKRHYLDVTGVSKEEAFDDPSELQDWVLDELLFMEEDGQKKTFREKLQELINEGVEFPRCFAIGES